MINEILERFHKLGLRATEKQILSAVRRAKIRRGLDRKEDFVCSDWSYAVEAVAHIAKARVVEKTQAAERKLKATAYAMDDKVREAVHAELSPCTAEEFLARYIELHLEMTGEPWMYANWPNGG